jgi:hypothetical protein
MVVVSVTFQPLYFLVISRLYLVARGVDGRGGEEEKSIPLPGIEPQSGL